MWHLTASLWNIQVFSVLLDKIQTWSRVEIHCARTRSVLTAKVFIWAAERTAHANILLNLAWIILLALLTAVCRNVSSRTQLSRWETEKTGQATPLMTDTDTAQRWKSSAVSLRSFALKLHACRVGVNTLNIVYIQYSTVHEILVTIINYEPIPNHRDSSSSED